MKTVNAVKSYPKINKNGIKGKHHIANAIGRQKIPKIGERNIRKTVIGVKQ
jgi:hypothetical protein